MVNADQSGYLNWPKLGLSLATINIISEPLLRPDWHLVFQFCTVLYSYGKPGIDKMKKLVKMMKQVNKLMIMSLRIVSTKEIWSALGYPEQGPGLDCLDTLVSNKLC